MSGNRKNGGQLSESETVEKNETVVRIRDRQRDERQP